MSIILVVLVSKAVPSHDTLICVCLGVDLKYHQHFCVDLTIQLAVYSWKWFSVLVFSLVCKLVASRMRKNRQGFDFVLWELIGLLNIESLTITVNIDALLCRDIATSCREKVVWGLEKR